MIKNMIILTAFSLLFSACAKQKPNKETNKKDHCIITPELKKLLLFERIDTTQASVDLDLTGNVGYDQNHIFHYQSLSNGVAERVMFKLGDFVHKGQVLFELRTFDLSEQKSALSRVHAELNLSKRNLKSVENLYNDGLASEKELLEAQNEFNNHTSEINKIKESANIQGGNIERGRIVVRAPMNGYIVAKNIMSGSQVNAGDDNLFILSDLKKVWVMANVYSAQLGKVEVGAAVDISTTAYPGKEFPGKISRLSNIFDPEEKVMKAIIEMDNSNMMLKPDMMVNVRVHQNATQKAFAIPVKCAVFNDDAYYVISYHDDCNVGLVEIRPFSYDANYYYVSLENEHLHLGDTLISQNQLLLFNELKGR